MRSLEGGPEAEEYDVARLAQLYQTTPEKILAAIKAGRKFPKFSS